MGDKEKLIRQLVACGLYNYPLERVADILNLPYTDLLLAISADAELSEAYNNALDAVKRRTVENLIESTRDKIVRLRKPFKLREGKNELLKYVEEDTFIRGDTNAMRFLLVNLDPEKWSVDGRHNAGAIGPVVINITPVDAPDVTIQTHDGEDKN